MILDGHAEMLPQRFEQIDIPIGQGLRAAKIEVVNAQSLLVVKDGERGGCRETFADTTAQLHARRWIGGLKSGRDPGLDHFAAQAFAAIEFCFNRDELVGQAFMRHQIQGFLVGGVEPDSTAIRPQRLS